MSSSNLPEGGMKLTVDLTEWEKNWQSALDDTDTLTQALDDLSSTNVDVGVSLDMPDVSEFDEITALDGETITPSLDTQETESGKAVREGITFLATMERIRLVIDIAGSVIDFLANTGSSLVNPFLDVEQVVSRINAQTGTAIPDLDQFIRDIQYADLGDSVEQIGDVVTEAIRLKAPLDEGTRAALTFTHTFSDQSPVTVLDALNTAATQFGISISAAGDLMTVFFQHGGNVGGDALGVVQANAQSWADMGLTLTEALSAVSSLQQGTGATATDAAKMLQTFDDAMTAAASDPGSQQAKMLSMMGIANPKDAGQAIGAETIDGFAAAFTDMPSEVQDQISGMFFGKGGKKLTSAIGDMSTQSTMFSDVIGASADAATEIDNNLRGVIDDFVLAFNEKVSELLSSDAIDLPGKIADLKEGLQKALDVIANGGTVGEAIEIGLNMPGFNDAVSRFEASIGSFVISVLEIIAGIQDFLNKDSSGTRRQIAQKEREQLPFNLKVANADEIAGELQTAIDRGLSTSDIATATNTALNEMIGGGDLDKAQALVDSLNQLSESGGPMLSPDISAVGRQEALVALRMAESGDTSRIQEQLDKGNLIAPVSIDTEAFQMQIDAAQKQFDQSQLKFGPNPATANPLGPFGAEQGANIASAFTSGIFAPGASGGGVLGGITDNMTKALDDLKTNAETNMPAVSTAVTTATDESTASLQGLSLQAQLTDADIAAAMTDNTVTASFEAVLAAANSSFPGVIEWFNRTSAAAAAFDISMSSHTQHILNMLHDLQFLSAQVSTGVQAALTLGAGLPPQPVGLTGGGNGGGPGITNNSVVVNNTLHTTAGAAANGYAIGAALRGR